MPRTDGNAAVFVGGTTGIPLPKPDYDATRHGHRRHLDTRPTGLDWSKHTAPEPPAATSDEGEKRATPQVNSPGKRRPRDGTRLGRALAELEEQDPEVAAAADRLDDALARAAHPEDHLMASPDAGESDVSRAETSSPEQTAFKRQLKPHLATADVVDVINAYRAGDSTAVLMKRHRIGFTRLRSILTDNGVTIRPHGRENGPVDHQAIVDAYLADETRSTYDVAALVGCAQRTVIKALDAAGVPRRSTRPGQKPTPVDVEQILAEYRAGDGVMVLSKRHHIGSRRISQLLTENGVPRHTPGPPPKTRQRRTGPTAARDEPHAAVLDHLPAAAAAAIDRLDDIVDRIAALRARVSDELAAIATDVDQVLGEITGSR